ncbi:MAG: histidinol dehydrogenase [Planctomycetota bacterium]|nr:histidinol dehydrogenase [Planctomycetota bacterium]
MSTPLLRPVLPEACTLERRSPIDRGTCVEVARILEDIEARGEPAVREHAARLGDLEIGRACVHDRAALDAARDRLSPRERDAMERAGARIRAFARLQRDCIRDLDASIEGGRAGHTCIPVNCAGCYAPGGRFPLPSSVLMTAITARAAGVEVVWIASPRPTDATLAAASIAGADGLLALGGAQAIAAMALGLCGVPACDMIVGPGNRWVTAAKFLLSDRVGIDMLAGPSELVVLADDSADPALVAADLLAQAEHDEDALPILISTDATLPGRVDEHLSGMLVSLPTRATAQAALRNGFSVVVRDIDRAIELCDAIAPEHLEIMTRDASRTAARVRNAGAVFVGSASAEVLGDYGAGPNHVLPTGGTARSRAGLSVFSFLRPRTWLDIQARTPSVRLSQDAQTLARVEGLEAHARAAGLRM